MGLRTRKVKAISATGIRILTDKADIPAVFQEQLDLESPSIYYILYLDAEPIGCAQIIDYGDQTFELAYVFILETFRRQGYGRDFVRFVVYNHAAPQLQVLTVTPQFFESLGFVRVAGYPEFVDHS